MMGYDDKQFDEREIGEVTGFAARRRMPGVNWINVDGLHDTALAEEIGRVFDLHPLVLEDILNTQQRPKAEHFDNYIFVVLRF
jgi:magnesium transporter